MPKRPGKVSVAVTVCGEKPRSVRESVTGLSSGGARRALEAAKVTQVRCAPVRVSFTLDKHLMVFDAQTARPPTGSPWATAPTGRRALPSPLPPGTALPARWLSPPRCWAAFTSASPPCRRTGRTARLTPVRWPPRRPHGTRGCSRRHTAFRTLRITAPTAGRQRPRSTAGPIRQFPGRGRRCNWPGRSCRRCGLRAAT